MIDVEKLIKQNSELMALLKIIHSFQLNDCWLCAGTIRNYIWDYLSTGNTSSNINYLISMSFSLIKIYHMNELLK